jgi:hypothetical protein
MVLTQKISICFLILGASLLASSYLLTSQVLALLSLGLLFWGALFLVITPTRYVEASLMSSTVLSSYTSIDRIIREFDCKGKPLHIPPYPKDVYIPAHLKGLKEMVAFIPTTEETYTTPSIDEIAQGKFIVENPQGIILTPPGLQLLTKIEEKSKADFTETSINDLCDIFPKNILDNFSLAKEISMTIKENEVVVSLTGLTYRDIYVNLERPKSINLLGCPVVSAIACAIAKSSGKPVTIQAIKIASDTPTIAVKYKIIEID